MRVIVKILHTVSAAGLLGGLLAYMVLLVASPQDTPAAVLDMRISLLAVSDYLIVPSMGVCLVTGLLAMVVHRPFMDQGWALIKAFVGILMLKAVLGLAGAKASSAARFAEQVAANEVSQEVLEKAVRGEWGMMWMTALIAVANFVLGVWRPKLVKLRPHPTA